MNRRGFIQTLGAGMLSMQGCRMMPLRNPCLDTILPASITSHSIVQTALSGLVPELLWDGHVHLLGTGDGDSGIWINPHMRSLLHPVQSAQFYFFTNASCTEPGNVDNSYIQRLIEQHKSMPAGARLLLLAFDYTYDRDGKRRPDLSAFYTPNAYAAHVADTYPGVFRWIASVHPNREDWHDELRVAAGAGACAIKWLPSAMGIDPGSPSCDRFYEMLVKYNLPLLVHAGEESAVHGANRQEYGNPLLLRRPLEHGVRVIIAHCASLGRCQDIDAGKNGGSLPAFELFARLMNDARYENLLFGEISGLVQTNRLGTPIDTVIRNTDWHPRLVNASDYPLPGVLPLFSMEKLVARGYIDTMQAQVLTEIRRHNVLLFDLVLKRLLQSDGTRLSPIVFHSRRVFDNVLIRS